MQITKRILILYFLGLVVISVHQLLLGISSRHLSDAFFLSLIPAVVIMVGLVLGWFGTMIIQYSRWVKSFYLVGLNLSFVIFVMVLGYFQIQAKLKSRRYGNDHFARNILEFADESGYRFTADGYEKLLSKFPEPNQLHLLGYLTNFRDTTAGPEKDTIRTVYYTYFLGKDFAARRFGKVEIWRSRVKVLAIDQLPNSDTCYLRLNKDFDQNKKMVDSLISTLKLVK